MAQAQACAPHLQPLRGGIAPQRTHGAPRQHEVGGAQRTHARAHEAVAQHAQKHLATGFAGGRVQGRHAQGVDELGQQSRAEARAQLRHAQIGCADKALRAPAPSHTQQAELVGPAPAFCGGNAPGGVKRGGPIGQGQAGAVGKGQGQRQAQKRVVGVGAHQAHQRKAGAVGADEDVLAVVEIERARGAGGVGVVGFVGFAVR